MYIEVTVKISEEPSSTKHMHRLNPKLNLLCGGLCLASLATVLLLLTPPAQAQSTPASTKIEVLGTGAESLLMSPLNDPNNDGLDALDGAMDTSWDWEEASASLEPDFEGGENAFNVFDHKLGGGNDKWCCDDPTPDNPVWVAVKFKQVVSLTHFTVSSANDSPDRDPVDWAIQGSSDGTTYTDIYHFTDATALWTERLEVIKFTLPSPSPAYRYIRYIAYDTPGSLHQIGEIEFFGIVGGANPDDKDNDGMPDQWETEHGLDPNDPTDAAKDCNGNGLTNLQEYQMGLEPCDTTKPAVLSASTTSSFDTVAITFSKSLDPASATNIANYTISPSLAVTAAAYKNKVVTLTTAPQTPGGVAYTVAVKGVKDTELFEVPEGSNTATFFSYMMTKQGVLKFAYYGADFGGGEAISGTPVENLILDPRYPDSPNMVGAVYSFNSRDIFPNDSHENYGATMEGYLTPTVSGSYRFFVYSDDASEFYISTDDTEANLVKVAEETSCCNNFTEPAATHDEMLRTSDPIALVAGKKYLVRMIYKEGTGGDYGQVAWRMEGDTTAASSLRPISGKYLSAQNEWPYPAEGVLVTQSPAASAKGVKPNAPITIVHLDGKSAWTTANVSMKIDGAAVTPILTKDAAEMTISLVPTGLYASGSTHTIALTYPDPAGNPATMEWTFTVSAYSGPTKDIIKGVGGLLMGKAVYTADKGGYSGKDADYAIDFGKTGNAWVDIIDASFLNTAAAKDEMSFSFWVYRYDINASSAFWAVSASAGRGFQAHTPWSDDNIYFDTMGCCDATTQRISASITGLGSYGPDDMAEMASFCLHEEGGSEEHLHRRRTVPQRQQLQSAQV